MGDGRWIDCYEIVHRGNSVVDVKFQILAGERLQNGRFAWREEKRWMKGGGRLCVCLCVIQHKNNPQPCCCATIHMPTQGPVSFFAWLSIHACGDASTLHQSPPVWDHKEAEQFLSSVCAQGCRAGLQFCTKNSRAGELQPPINHTMLGWLEQWYDTLTLSGCRGMDGGRVGRGGVGGHQAGWIAGGRVMMLL